MKLCVFFAIFLTEAWYGLNPVSAIIFGRSQQPFFATPVDPTVVRNALFSGKMLVELGKQELRELSELAGVQIGGDLLFSNDNSDKATYLGAGNQIYKQNSNVPVTTMKTDTQKSTSNVNADTPFSSFTASLKNTDGSELVYKPNVLPIPMSLEMADTPAPASSGSSDTNQTPPYAGSFNPLAADDFHAAFSVQTSSQNRVNYAPKPPTNPLFYPIQFYSEEALKKATSQEKPLILNPLVQESQYDNEFAW